MAVKRSANTSITLSIVLANNNANENVKAGSNQRHAHLKVKNRFKIKAHKKIQVSSWVYKNFSQMIAFTESLFFSSKPYIEDIWENNNFGSQKMPRFAGFLSFTIRNRNKCAQNRLYNCMHHIQKYNVTQRKKI